MILNIPVFAHFLFNAGSKLRQCDGLTLATKDACTIEAVMSTAITTTIEIARDVPEPNNDLLYKVYKLSVVV